MSPHCHHVAVSSSRLRLRHAVIVVDAGIGQDHKDHDSKTIYIPICLYILNAYLHLNVLGQII